MYSRESRHSQNHDFFSIRVQADPTEARACEMIVMGASSVYRDELIRVSPSVTAKDSQSGFLISRAMSAL
jgi:hypothetical protein